MGPQEQKLKILIFGASGLLGSELAMAASSCGHDLFLVTRRDEIIVPGAKHIIMDLEKIDFSRLRHVDAIFYLAQSKKFRNFPEDWQDVYNINVTIPLQIISWAKDHNVSQFHLASSGGVYSGSGRAIEESTAINANRELGFYLSTRLASELLVKNFSSYFKTFTIIRPFFIYGKRQLRSMLIPRLIDSVIEGKTIFLNGEEGIKINPIHVSDAAEVCLKLMNTTGFNIYNLAGPEVLSMKQICDIISKEVNVDPVFIRKESGEDLIGDNSKIETLMSGKMKTFASCFKELLPKKSL